LYILFPNSDIREVDKMPRDNQTKVVLK